jgi:hypothetical protein
MADPHSWRILSRSPGLSSREADFYQCLCTIEDEVRRLPQNLCVVLTHTPLTQDGSRYSRFEGQGHRLGTHWHSEGEMPRYPLVGQPPATFPFGSDRFPFGVVLSRTSSLLDLTVDSAGRTWLNFGGKGGFYVSDDGVRDSLPEGKLAHELTERTIWHYFVENMGEPIPNESMFASVNEQLLHCYHGIRETFMFPELDWPEVLLSVGLKHPGPFFGVERESVVRSFQGEKLVQWGKPDECHHVFRVRPHSVARATLFALEELCRIVHFVDEPAGDASPGIKAVAAITMARSPDGTASKSNGGTSTPSSHRQSTERGEDNSDPTILKESDRAAKAFMDGKQWCTADYARDRYGIKPQQLHRASTQEKGLKGITVTREKAQVGRGKRGQVLVYHVGDLQRLANALDGEE